MASTPRGGGPAGRGPRRKRAASRVRSCAGGLARCIGSIISVAGRDNISGFEIRLPENCRNRRAVGRLQSSPYSTQGPWIERSFAKREPPPIFLDTNLG